MSVRSAIVIGSGFAGLSATLELQRRGVAVRVLEAADRPGGRAQSWSAAGYRFDLGPTLLVMTDLLRSALGDEAFDALALQRLEPGYRVRFADGASFAMQSDIALVLQEFARFEPGRASRALRYLADVHGAHVDARSRILERDHTLASFARTILSPGRIRPWIAGSLRAFTERYFHDPRVVQALTFQPLYLGTSPLRSPAMYALLPVEEMVGGVWYARGGTGAVVDAFVREAQRRGAEFAFDTRAERVEMRADGGVRVHAGATSYDADALVVAADREPSLGLFGDEAPRGRSPRYGHTACVWYFGLDAPVALDHHTVMLPRDPWGAYAHLDAGRVPDETMLYVCNPAATDPSVAPPGGSALLVLAPVPNRALAPSLDLDAMRERVLDALEAQAGPLRGRIVVERRRGPEEFERELGLMHGAAFGPDHTLDQMGPFRPAIRHPRLRNVVFAGSGTRPGSGVPMVVISGRLAADALLA
ncbi:MAG: phytoene desaturase [bacterium]|nr:phytoene desaturase [bacterium]